MHLRGLKRQRNGDQTICKDPDSNNRRVYGRELYFEDSLLKTNAQKLTAAP